MTISASSTVTFVLVNNEINRAASATTRLSELRALAGNSAGPISMGNFRRKTGITLFTTRVAQTTGYSRVGSAVGAMVDPADGSTNAIFPGTFLEVFTSLDDLGLLRLAITSAGAATIGTITSLRFNGNVYLTANANFFGTGAGITQWRWPFASAGDVIVPNTTYFVVLTSP